MWVARCRGFALSDADYRRNVGAFFKSMHGTLNHLLVADRIWLKRSRAKGTIPTGSTPLSMTIGVRSPLPARMRMIG